MKLFYFPVPGRAEATRLMLTQASLPFEVPYLELDDGKTLTQQLAIEDYVAKLTGYYPSDPWLCARGDEVRGLLQEAFGAVFATLSIKDHEERRQKQEELIRGSVKAVFDNITQRVEALNDKHLGGDEVSVADLSLFTALDFLTSGFFDGIPKTLLDDWPHLQSFHQQMHRMLTLGSLQPGREPRLQRKGRRLLFFGRRSR